MRLIRPACLLTIFIIFSVSVLANSRKVVAVGKLTRIAAGGESTRWYIELSPVMTVDGKQIGSVEIKTSKTKRLEALENKTVVVKGTLTEVESEHPVLELASPKDIKDIKDAKEKKESLMNRIAFFLEAL